MRAIPIYRQLMGVGKAPHSGPLRRLGAVQRQEKDRDNPVQDERQIRQIATDSLEGLRWSMKES